MQCACVWTTTFERNDLWYKLSASWLIFFEGQGQGQVRGSGGSGGPEKVTSQIAVDFNGQDSVNLQTDTVTDYGSFHFNTATRLKLYNHFVT